MSILDPLLFISNADAALEDGGVSGRVLYSMYKPYFLSCDDYQVQFKPTRDSLSVSVPDWTSVATPRLACSHMKLIDRMKMSPSETEGELMPTACRGQGENN